MCLLLHCRWDFTIKVSRHSECTVSQIKTLKPRQTAVIVQTTFDNSFSWMNIVVFIDISLKFVHKSPVNNKPALTHTVYPKKYAHGFVVLCFVVVMQSFIMNSHEVFIYINQGCFAGTGAIVRLPQCQWSKPDGYGKISQCITTTKHSKAKTVCIFLGIYCTVAWWRTSHKPLFKSRMGLV